MKSPYWLFGWEMQTLQKNSLELQIWVNFTFCVFGSLQSLGSKQADASSANLFAHFPSPTYTIILCLPPCLTRPPLKIPSSLCARPTQTSPFPSIHSFFSQSQIISQGIV